MIIVADSGSTKTDWVLIEAGQSPKTFSSIGLNPFFVSSLEISDVIRGLVSDDEARAVNSIWFYGAGCSSPERNKVVSDGLAKVCVNAEISIEHDLLAAAKALFGDQSGIGCILGTGSNSCFYDGTQIVKNIPALGFMLGDDGSGAYLGRALVRAYLYEELNPGPVAAIEKGLGLNKEAIFTGVYSGKHPSRFLASLAPLCSEHRDDESVRKVIDGVINDFCDRLLVKYKPYASHPVGIVGSIGTAFEDEFRVQIEKRGFHLGPMLKKPIQALVDYHTR